MKSNFDGQKAQGVKDQKQKGRQAQQTGSSIPGENPIKEDQEHPEKAWSPGQQTDRQNERNKPHSESNLSGGKGGIQEFENSNSESDNGVNSDQSANENDDTQGGSGNFSNQGVGGNIGKPGDFSKTDEESEGSSDEKRGED